MITNQKDNLIRIIKGDERYANSENVDLSLKINLNSTKKNYVEGNRSNVVNLEERFTTERDKSTIFRISGKITNIFNNTISGQTSYEPFKNSLYYLNAVNAIELGTPWRGYPQYDEFSFFRTKGIDGHINFNPKSGTSYNWMLYVTYVSNQIDNKNLKIKFETNSGTITNNFNVSDGVPYYIKNRKINGKNVITFYCGFKHNLSVGEWIYLKDVVNGKREFQVYELGDEYYGNEDKVFSIYNFGYNDALFGNNAIGTFKRVIDIKNSAETISNYYIQKHKVLTEISDCVVSKMGFERNPFPIKKQLEYSALTPNNIQRTSIKDGSQTVGFSFKKDVDINGLMDNLNRPVTKLYVSIVNRGYMGWFHNPYVLGNNTGIQVGWDYNFLENEVDNWWDISNTLNRDNINTHYYTTNGNQFFYNKSFEIGDEFMGSICESNNYEQTENKLSEIYHKFSFNPQLFDNSSPNNLPDGYSYKPHYEVKIRDFSDTLEVGERGKVDLVPDYAFFSKNDNQWRWRDLYTYGFIDDEGNGVDNPFLNGAHYTFSDILFLQTPIKRNTNVNNDIIFAPLQDNCE